MIGRVTVPAGTITLEDDGRWTVAFEGPGAAAVARSIESCLAMALPLGGPEQGQPGYSQLNALAAALGTEAEFEEKAPSPEGVIY